MAREGRKNVHGKAGVRFKAGYTASKHKSMLRNVASELIVNEKVVVTRAVAYDLKREADRLVTLAKRGDLHARRLAASYVRPIVANKTTGQLALGKLFDELGPRFAKRDGGYTRVLKVENRRGDNAPMALVTWVE